MLMVCFSVYQVLQPDSRYRTNASKPDWHSHIPADILFSGEQKMETLMGVVSMKRMLGLFMLFAAMSTMTLYAGTWTGYISDAKCGLKGNEAGHADCAKSCIAAGEAAVLVAGGKLYSLDKQDEAKALAGEKVVVKGTASKDGKTIMVQSIAKAGK
jgi:hypothetical protein